MSVDREVNPVTATDDPDDYSSNPSDNRPFRDVLAARLSRRDMARGGTVVAAAGFFGAAVVGSAVPAAATAPAARVFGRKPLLGFTAVTPSVEDAVVIPEGYEQQVLIPWGTPIRPGGPAFKQDASNTAAEQAQQVGMHHDANCYFPLGRGREANTHGLLVTNHEYTDNTLLFTDGNAVMTKEKVDKAIAAHGVSVVEIAKVRGEWKVVGGQYARRITGATPVRFSGPVPESHPRLQSNNEPMGTLNNCSYGETPWGTYLACEENFNGYFGTTGAFTPNPEQTRYGISRTGGTDNRWYEADPRFDLLANPNEVNRFGWVVEIDPFKPGSKPVKRTALGRFKHEGATVWESRGRVVVYSGDDQADDYVYKFVSSGPWRWLKATGRSPLDHGTLYVGKFNDDGTGEWLPLIFGQGPLTVANGWADQADVLMRTRQAADAVGATKLDRPEWITVHPKTDAVYMSLTNSTIPPVTGPNPRHPNPFGHIIRWWYRYGDNTAATFEWDIFLLAGDPTKPVPVGQPAPTVSDENRFGSPDGLWFDPDGRLWIQTDVSTSTLNTGLYDRIGNNQMLAADPATGELRRFLVGPKGCEVTGIDLTPDQRTMFVNIQHPGEAGTDGTPTPGDPTAVSTWPDGKDAGRPRSATVVVWKTDGGVIGS